MGFTKARTEIVRNIPPGWRGMSFDGGYTITDKTIIPGSVLLGYEETTSTSHPGFNKLLGRGGDVGGPFQTYKKWYSESGTPVRHYGVSYYDYNGILYPHWDPYAFPTYWTNTSIRSSNDLLFALGGTAISRTLPTNPVGGAAVFLGELREEFPHLVGEAMFKALVKKHKFSKGRKALGGEYLNVEFGWKPLINDIRNLSRGIIEHDKIMQQLARDSGRNVKRRYKFPPSVSETLQSSNTYALERQDGTVMETPIYAGYASTQVLERSSTKRWFSGCYTYTLPDYNELFGIRRYVAEAEKCLGAEPTPDAIWNLAPWSWMSDWFINTGDLLRNLTAFSQNDLVLRYGYIMEEKTQHLQINGDQLINTRFNGVVRANPSLTFGVTSKLRLKASPFGFGLTIEDFTPRQMAIVGALGISRAH